MVMMVMGAGVVMMTFQLVLAMAAIVSLFVAGVAGAQLIRSIWARRTRRSLPADAMITAFGTASPFAPERGGRVGTRH